MSTGLLEKHVRRVVWRHCNKKEIWKVYGFLVVAFGDRPAACLLDIVIKISCQLFQSVDPMAALRLTNDMFVDDLASGGENHEVDRFKGVESPETMRCSGTMTQIMEQGGLRFKAMITSWEEDEEKLNKLGGAVLGIPWISGTDRWCIKFHVNLSKKKKGQPTGPDLSIETLVDLDKIILTKRVCLSVSNSLYDPLGLVSPIIIILKVSMKELYSAEHELTWDKVIPEKLRRKWIAMIEMLVKSEPIEFERAVMPY